MLGDTDSFAAIIARLTLEEKVSLVTGADFWSTVAIDRIGLRSMVLSDGPSGVRGPIWDERSPSLNLPSATALAASWDPALIHRSGFAAAAEARRKNVDIVLGPTINLHRSPLGGRHFECFSEDPLLTGVLAAAYVRGLQDNGVAATPKHFVANDSETDRFTIDVNVEERVLRELYLMPFEMAVEAGTWAIMSAYTSIDGVPMTENSLLESPLNSDWGFDGVVVSDWTAVRGLEAATAHQDLAMPGPSAAWGDNLLEAIRDGRVDEKHLDRKVERLLRLAHRVGALGTVAARMPILEGGRAFAREAAIAGATLLENRNELPWNGGDLKRIAVIGQSADLVRTQGGGSAMVIPESVVSPLEGIRQALPNAEIRYEIGAVVQEGVVELPLSQLTNPVTRGLGTRLTFLDHEGGVLMTDDRRASSFIWFDGDVPLAESKTIVVETEYQPLASGSLHLGFASSKHGRILVDGVSIIDEKLPFEGLDVGAALMSPPSITVEIPVIAGSAIHIRGEFEVDSANEPLAGAAAVTIGSRVPHTDPEYLIARAVEAARDADVVLVVVGTNTMTESEGVDRQNLDLPGRQDDLVAAVAAANPHTVVLVNSGAPVIMPWRDDVAAIVLGYFGGQEFGAAVADVLLGLAEPGGRLTTTWPKTLADVPVLNVTPTDGVLDYSEGIHIGYRAWLAADIAPAYPFGWGLGYTTWSSEAPKVRGSLGGADLAVSMRITNTGNRRGKHVAQVYVERSDSAIDRPVRWLAGFRSNTAEPGESIDVTIPLTRLAFRHWTGGRDGLWDIEPGEFQIRVGSSIDDLHAPVTIDPQNGGA